MESVALINGTIGMGLFVGNVEVLSRCGKMELHALWDHHAKVVAKTGLLIGGGKQLLGVDMSLAGRTVLGALGGQHAMHAPTPPIIGIVGQVIGVGMSLAGGTVLVALGVHHATHAPTPQLIGPA